MDKDLTTDFDEDLDEYLGVALYAQSGGFSKGTANVSSHDVDKLKGLLKFYAKKKHPFTACVRDNRKRFGANTEKYCAVLKDLIVGNTKWRNKKANLSEEELVEDFALDVPEDFLDYISEADFSQLMDIENLDLAAGDVAWDSNKSWNAITRSIEEQLNHDNGYNSESDTVGNYYRVDDVNGNQALVCSYPDYYVVPFTIDKSGKVTVSEETDWTKVEKEWVETSMGFSEENQLGAEMHLSSEDEQIELSDDGLIWKTILREGTWKVSPGPGQSPRSKPITVVPDGKSDGKNLVISMKELKENFDAGVVEHVTIPTSHADRVLENTGFVKGLKFDTDAKGRKVLKAGMHFTEPDVKDKAIRGTIANTSAGILFDYVNKESGQKNSAVLGHAALTNHPWLTDMQPFGVLASENLEVVNFSEDQTEVIESDDKSEGGVVMSEAVIEAPKFLADLGLSEDEARARLARYEELEAKEREHTINEKVRGWNEANKAPALVKLAQTLLSQASDTETVLNLSEDGKTVGLTAVDIIDRFMETAPALSLSEDPVTEKDVQDDKPAIDAEAEVGLSAEEKLLANQLWLDEGFTKEEAEAEAKKRLKSE